MIIPEPTECGGYADNLIQESRSIDVFVNVNIIKSASESEARPGYTQCECPASNLEPRNANFSLPAMRGLPHE